MTVTLCLEQKAASHFSQMSETFRSKAQHLAEQVISDVKTSTIQEPEIDTATPATPAPTPQLEGKAATVEKEPHAYHEESRASEFGTLLNGVIFGVAVALQLVWP